MVFIRLCVRTMNLVVVETPFVFDLKHIEGYCLSRHISYVCVTELGTEINA